jgi:DNA-binding SARP family transcriptional activator/Tfp pilus assembly protein PilF
MLGGAALVRDGRTVGVVHVQRKTLALLALLATARERGISRDRLVAYLWPESDAKHALGALKQALHVIRQQLGTADGILGTAQLRLNGATVVSDVDEFLTALNAGESERAVSLYAGPFLDGFHLSGAPEFEQWVESQRRDLASRYAAVAERLAVDAGTRGDHATAVERWRLLQAGDPLSARLTLGLMNALETAGDRATALQCAEAYEALVQRELGASPTGPVAALAARLRRESRLAARGETHASDGDSPIDRGTTDPEAYELYLRARQLWKLRTPDGLREARTYYEAAVERDPLFARAWAGLAQAYVNLGNFGYVELREALALAKRAADRAIELDPHSADAHSANGYVHASRLEFDAGERALRAAIATNPRHSWAHHFYTLLLMMLGRTAEARERNREAIAVDPLSRAAVTTRGAILLQEEDYDGAARELRQALALAPEFPLTLYYLGVVRIAQEAYDEALTLLERAASLAPGFTGVPGALAFLHRHAGRQEEVDACLQRLRQATQHERTRTNLALALGVVGELDEAFALMDRLGWDVPSLIELRVDPLLRPLRADPRYGQLLRRLGAS